MASVWENKLTSGGISIIDVLKWSRAYYKSKGGDDKSRRAKLDVVNCKLIKRNNFDYNSSTKKWEQKEGSDILFVFIVKSNPVSYPDTSGIKNHLYPVYFLIHDFNAGLKSTFKWRTGSLYKPIFAKAGLSKEQRQKITNKTIKVGIQMQFITELMYVLYQRGLLWGRNWCSRPAKIKNPHSKIFFDKHAYSLVVNYLVKLFRNDKFKALINKTYKLK